MDDLIRRQDAIGKIKDWMKFIGYSHSERNVMECTIQMLEELPSAQKTGKWEEIDIKDYKAKCSSCVTWSPIMGRYCPHCGAMMEEDE